MVKLFKFSFLVFYVFEEGSFRGIREIVDFDGLFI